MNETPITSSFAVDQFISDRWNLGNAGGKPWTSERMKDALVSHFCMSAAQAHKDVEAFAEWEDRNVRS